MVASGEARLVEREHELRALERVVHLARAGSGAALVVEGPPGIGKSGLLSAARGEAAVLGLGVLFARGGELEREFPFGIARQLLEPVVVAADPGERARLLAGAAALAEPVVIGPAGGDAVEASFAALHGLYWLAANVASVRPALVVADDVQWADLASLRWLVFLARRLEGVPLGLVVAARSGEIGPSGELLDDLAAIPEVEVLRPVGLSEAGSGEVVSELLAGEPDRVFVSACHGATGGNPFLLRELLGELSRRGVAPTRENAGAASGLSSQGVGRAVRSRLRRLGPDCAALARAVAVLGDGAEAGIAARLAELDEIAAAAAADRLVDESIFAAGRPLGFVHPLVRSSVAAELTAGERSAGHERAARLLGQAGAPPDRIALHLLATAPRADREVVDVLRRAGAQASARGAPDAAMAFLGRALQEPPSDELRANVAHELGVAALRAGDVDVAIVRLREATRGLPDAVGRAQAADSLASALFLANRSDEAMTELTSVIDELPDSEREQGLRLQATRWVAPRVSTAEWRRLLENGDRFEVRDGSSGTTGERLALAVASLHAVRGRTAAEARELAKRAVHGGVLLADPGPESAGFWIAPLVLMWAGALDDASAVTNDVIGWTRRHGSLPAFSMATQVRAFVCWLRGALDEAEADAATALEDAAPGFSPYGHFALANVLLARGQLDEVDELLSQPPFEPGSPSRSIFYYLQTRARLRAAQQRPEEALDDLFACARFEEAWQIRTPAVCNWRADAAPLLASLDRREEAGALAEDELERCRAFGAPVPLSAALRALGALDPGRGGLEPLEQSVSVLEGSPALLERSLARLSFGSGLRRAGRRADARAPLRDARELARRCGAVAVAARAHDELVAAGARPRRDPIDSRSNLTASELRVARLAAEGMTNREVAQALFLTENTIETHLRSVYRKLDINSRSQLARAL